MFYAAVCSVVTYRLPPVGDDSAHMLLAAYQCLQRTHWGRCWGWGWGGGGGWGWGRGGCWGRGGHRRWCWCWCWGAAVARRRHHSARRQDPDVSTIGEEFRFAGCDAAPSRVAAVYCVETICIGATGCGVATLQDAGLHGVVVPLQDASVVAAHIDWKPAWARTHNIAHTSLWQACRQCVCVSSIVLVT
jgi:hypothetical protein